MSWWERESKHKPWIFFTVFCSSSNILIRFFCLHRVASIVRPFFGAHPQNGSLKLFSPYVFVASVPLTVFSSSRPLANSLKPSRPLPSPWDRREGHPFLLVPHMHRRFQDLLFFSSHLQLTQSFPRDRLTHNQRFSLGHSKVSRQLP